MKNKLYIIGQGVGGEAYLTEKAKATIRSADRVINSRDTRVKGLLDLLKTSVQGTTVALISGDCGFFSVAKTICRDFAELYEIELINGISSLQYLSAKIAVPYDDAKFISLHGRDTNIIPYATYHKKLFVLTGGNQKPHDVCAQLNECGMPDLKVCVGEKLSFEDERLLTGTAAELCHEKFDDLSIMYIENESAQNPHVPLKDSDFIRGDVPMTKEEIRAVALQKLLIAPTDVLYDIGAGTGSMSVEMARKAFEGFVFAIERKAEANELIEQNRKKHGAYNMKIVQAEAPEGLAALPVPDKVFIGGSAGNIREIIAALVQKNPHITIVTNAVTLQGLQGAMEGYATCGLTCTETVCVNVAKAERLGRVDMMKAQNPVYIISGRANADNSADSDDSGG